MRILITGGAGFIGLKLLEKLNKDDHEVIVFDNFSEQVHGVDNRNLINDLRAKSIVINDNISKVHNYRDILRDVEVVYHLASSTGTSQSMYEISEYYRNNVENTALLVDFIRQNCQKVFKFILSSSRAVYGEGSYLMNDSVVFPLPRKVDDLRKGEFRCSWNNNYSIVSVPTKEDSDLSPSSVYGVTKLLQEEIVKAFSKQSGVEVNIFRFQNVYGPGQSLVNPYTGVLGVFSNLLRKDMTIEVYEDGNLHRDFVYIDDITETLYKCISIKSDETIINLGSGVALSILDLARMLKLFYNSNSNIIVTDKYRVGDILCCFADISKAKKIYNFKPTPISSGLKKYANWVTTQEIPSNVIDKINESFNFDKIMRNKL